MKKLMTGGEASAYVMKQINPELVAAYPITPQSPIIEGFAKYVADGKVDTEFVMVESEHSAMSVCVGASAAGGRVMTASASQGLALMFEIIYVAAGLRLPIVMDVGNRALSAPINIHCDHSDTFPLRDSGWMQVYNENAQEVYDANLIGLKVAEEVNLPIMIMQDGFYTTHGYQNIDVLTDAQVRKFIGKPPKRDVLLEKNITIGSFSLQDSYYETRIQLHNAMEEARKVIPKVQKEFEKLTGRKNSMYETYKIKDAELIVIVLNSTAGTIRAAVDKLRKEGKKVGTLSLRYF